MKLMITLCFILLLTACDKAPEAVFEPLSDNAVILAFGDSLTYGVGADKAMAYPTILSHLSQREVINEGVSGEISRYGLLRLPTLLDDYQPELLILIHGGNDILKKIPLTQTKANLKQMIDLAHQRGIKVVMLGVPEPNVFSLSSAAIYQQIAEENQIPVDLNTLATILDDNALKSDMIHPNARGYQLMAENIFKLLQQSGAL